jgi:hypothetical protein
MHHLEPLQDAQVQHRIQPVWPGERSIRGLGMHGGCGQFYGG